MKKSKLLVLGVIALLLVGGLALAGCDEDENCHGEKGCYFEAKGYLGRKDNYYSDDYCHYSECAVAWAVADEKTVAWCDCK